MIREKLFILSLMTIFVSSCDYESNEHYLLDNKSSYDINIVYIDKLHGDNMDTTILTVFPNENKEFYLVTTLSGVSKDKGEDYLDVFDTIWTVVNDTLILNKDLYNMDNWDFWKQGTNDSDSKFTFTVTNTDLKTSK